MERAFAASNNNNYVNQNNLGIDNKDGNFSVFSGGSSNFSVFSHDFSDESQSISNNPAGQGKKQNQIADVHGAGSNTTTSSQSSGPKLHISSISKVIPSLNIGSKNTATANVPSSSDEPSKTPSASVAPVVNNNPGNRSSVKSFIKADPPVAPANAEREKSVIEKQMISQNKSYIRHRFDDMDEKGNATCKFQCQIYWAKQFEAVRQCYFNETDNENFIRSLSMSSRWTAQGLTIILILKHILH